MTVRGGGRLFFGYCIMTQLCQFSTKSSLPEMEAKIIIDTG